MSKKLRKILGQPSWELRTDKVKAFLTETGGHLGPVTFRLGKREIQPFSVAPWAEEKLAPDTPAILRVLRGDFFCMPFGGNTKPFGKEKHPVHGETANALWKPEENGEANCSAWSLQTNVRPGKVEKKVWVHPNETVIYQRHEITRMKGLMNLGHHAMLKFPEEAGSGIISTSPFEFGQVFPAPFEEPAEGGYNSLKPGAKFKKLSRVPLREGGYADLTRYPARAGFEDLIMLVSKLSGPFAWTAVTFPGERYVWFALKDPRVLRQTIFWISNRGRHYAPWNGRHSAVMGLEEVTSYFHEGIAESAAPNPMNEAGIPTCLQLDPKKPTVVNYIMGVSEISKDFEQVERIVPTAGGVTLISTNNLQVKVALRLDFLTAR